MTAPDVRSAEPIDRGRHARRGDLALFVAVGLAAFLLYTPTLRFDFTNWDDDRYVLDNPQIQALSRENAARWFTGFYFASYAPVNLASLALDHAVWGRDPFGYHLTNAALHALACALFALALRTSGASPIATGLGATLFAVHPAQVEAVAWVSQRKALLAMVFLLGAFLAWQRATRRESASLPAALGAMVLFVAAILSKATVALMPLAFLLGDWAAGRVPWTKALLRQAPFLAAGAAIVVVTREAWLAHPILREVHRAGHLSQHVALSLEAIGRYARILFFPVNLSALYDPPVSPTLGSVGVVVGAACILCGGAAFVWAARRARPLLEWMGFVWIGLLMALPVLTHPVYLADRFLHLPLLGFSACAGIGADCLGRRLSSRGRRTLVAALGFAIACFAALTLAREQVWRDSVSLWSHAVSHPPARWTAHANLGRALEERGDLQGAIRQYEIALDRFPEGIVPLLNLGNAYVRIGEPMRAESTLRRALAAPSPLASDHALAARSLGAVLGLSGRTEEAVSAFQEALRADPADGLSRLYLAQALRALGRLPEARLRFEQVLERDPRNPGALLGLAGVAIDAGNGARHRGVLDDLIREGRVLPEALLERARLDGQEGDVAAARRDLERALDLAPPGVLRRRILEARQALPGVARTPGR